MEEFRVFLPLLTDIPVRRQAAQCIEPSCKIIDHDEGVEMLLQLVMGFVVTGFHGCILQYPVHSFDLAVGPRVIRLREPVVDAVFIADAIKQMHEGMSVCFAMRKLDAIIGKYSVQVIRYDVDQTTQEVRGYAPCLPLMQLGLSKLLGPTAHGLYPRSSSVQGRSASFPSPR